MRLRVLHDMSFSPAMRERRRLGSFLSFSSSAESGVLAIIEIFEVERNQGYIWKVFAALLFRVFGSM